MGGFFGGLNIIFYEEFEKWRKKATFIGIKEYLYSYLSIHYPDVIKVIKINKSFKDEIINELNLY